MKMRYLAIVVALLIGVNLCILGGAYLNRREPAQAILSLSERELHVNYNRENSGVSLRLDWTPYRYSRSGWFNEEKLQDFGFDTEGMSASRRGHESWRERRVREGYVVLELAGDAWNQWRTERRQEITELEQQWNAEESDRRKEIERDLKWKRAALEEHSRLFPVDAGRDPEELRKRYPDRENYAVAGVTVRVYFSHRDDEVTMEGHFEDLLVRNIHVAKASRGAFLGTDRKFTARIAWGQRYEPWLVDAVGASD